MTHRQREIRYRWFRRIGWMGILALGIQTAAPAAEAGVRTVERAYRRYQAQRANRPEAPPDVRVLRKSEMLHLKGRGRIPSLAGQAKWDIIDNGVNLRTRNYTYTATDLTLPGAIGIPVSVVRTWNANDDREGPFGIGWSWSLDVRQAAGGLIKRKAAPSRTVPAQINNGRNMPVAKITAGSGGPSVQVFTVDGAQCQDASGDQWIAWRDADGLYTPPPWDHNEYESTYQSVRMGSGENQYLREYAVSTKITTPDGTVYFYETVPQPDGSLVVTDSNGNEVYAEQVLKWVEDRHGNRTTYTYQQAEVLHTYDTSSGERASRWVWKPFVQQVTNACNYSLVVQWNFAPGARQVFHPRVRQVSSYAPDGALLETIEYVYPDESRSVRQVWRHREGASRLLAAYEYTSWRVRDEYCSYLPPGYSCIETDLLSEIRDADGVKTQILYNSEIPDNQDRHWYRVAVSSLALPSGEIRNYLDLLAIEPFTPEEMLGCVVQVYYNADGSCIERKILYEQYGMDFGDPIDGSFAMRVQLVGSILPTFAPDSPYQITETRIYGGITQNLRVSIKGDLFAWLIRSSIACGIAEFDHYFRLLSPILDRFTDEDRRSAYVFDRLSARVPLVQNTYLDYNCFGQPLRVIQSRQEWINRGNGYWQLLTETLTIQQTEYYGKEFYYQKAWEKDAKGRTMRYFYHSRNAPQGYKGQLQAVYMDSISTTYPVSEVLEYNQNGQPVLSRSLQRLNPLRYVYTRTFYTDNEGEGDDATGQPQKVIEDYRYSGDTSAAAGINRISTTRYDQYGRPIYQSVYAPDSSSNEYANPSRLVRRLHTVYEEGSDQVALVERVNASNQPIQQLAAYTYTPAGRLLSATDYLSQVSNHLTYDSAGRVQASEEYWQNQLRYRWDYAYTGADLTSKQLTIYTGNQSQVWRWHYRNYITGSFHPWSRVFTRVIMEPPANISVPVPLVVDYVYDPTDKLRGVRFNVTPNPARGVQELLDEPMSEQAPQAYVFAWYVYDSLGRLNDLRYYKAECTASDPNNCNEQTNYTYQPLMRFEYFQRDANYTPAYDATNNRLLMRAYDYPDFNTPQLVRTEQYEYDALDRLAGVSYNGGAWQRWTYDVMGNRYGAGNPAYDGLNRLTQFGNAPIQHDLLGNRLQDGRYRYQWDALNRLISMQTYQQSGRFVVIGDSWRFAYRADGLRVVKEKVSQAVGLEGSAGGSSRVEYLYDGQMPVCEQEFVGSTLRTSRVNFLGARGIEAVLAIDHTRGNQARLSWLLYDGHGNLVRTMASDYTLSGFQWRGVWGEVQSSLGAGRGYCANLGHLEDETGLVYMRARYYEPLTGRFISEDPARDGVNWYLYADGNPVNRIDYDGKAAWLESFINWLTGILERAGQYAVAPLLEKVLKIPKILAGPEILADFVFGVACSLEKIARSLIRGGLTHIAEASVWLRAGMAGGSLGQMALGSYMGARSLIGGALEVAAGIALLSLAYFLAGTAYGLAE